MLNKNISVHGQYLFKQMRDKVAEHRARGEEIIDLTIGDVRYPLAPNVWDTLQGNIDALSQKVIGYSDIGGDMRLRELIACDYLSRGIHISPSDIYISDGIKSEIGRVSDIFRGRYIVPNPMYPVYRDYVESVGGEIITPQVNDRLLPQVDRLEVDEGIIYICSPLNPTGEAMTYIDLEKWVKYALSTHSIIIYDSAYSRYITTSKPHSIYEIEGADRCAIELCSYSKSSGFTGIRCGYTIFPQNLTHYDTDIVKCWRKYLGGRYNGTSALAEMCAIASYTEESIAYDNMIIGKYMSNAKRLRELFDSKGIRYLGGVDAPYLFVSIGMDSISTTEYLIDKCGIALTPGIGFGERGEGYVRISCFARDSEIDIATKRLRDIL